MQHNWRSGDDRVRSRAEKVLNTNLCGDLWRVIVVVQMESRAVRQGQPRGSDRVEVCTFGPRQQSTQKQSWIDRFEIMT